MKSKVIVINNKKTKIILLITIIFIGIFALNTINKENNNANQIDNYIQEEHLNIVNSEIIKTSNVIYKQKEIDFPKEIEGIEVIGKLEIPKINLTTYILVETSKENLNKSVTKLCGPKVNGIGNLCITGHNYHKERMFGNLNKLEIGDKIKITDMKGIEIEYQVNDIYKVYPKETDCLLKETGGERHITLITCTKGAIKRLIIKAVEIYD